MALHVYGVVSAAAPLPGVLRGRREAPVRLVAHGDLAAVVSEVDADARVGRDDLLAHARVLESLVEASTVLPVRFGVIVETDEEVARNVLEPGESGLTELLHSFDGLIQLTVKAYHDQDEALKHLLRERSELRVLRDHTGKGPAFYPAQLRLGEAIAAGLETLVSSDAAMLDDQLIGIAERMVLETSPVRTKFLMQRCWCSGRPAPGRMKRLRDLAERCRTAFGCATSARSPRTRLLTASWQVSRYGPDHRYSHLAAGSGEGRCLDC
jgi:hypothetical protein